MLKAISRVQLAALLIGPTVIALMGGGFSEKVRLGAGIAAWALVIVGLLIRRNPLPGSASGGIALFGLAALALLTALSLDWTPLRTVAKTNIEVSLLYLGAFIAFVPALREREAARLVEPAVLATAVLADLWGLSERILPRDFDLGPAGVTGGRLSQPLGYWNSLGALSGLGLVIAVRIAADRSRNRWVRIAASGTFPMLACALFMSYSRGGLAVTAAALAALIALRPNLRQAAIAVAAPLTGLAGALVADRSKEIKLLSGSLAERSSAGQSLGIVLLVSTLLVAIFAWLLLRSPGSQHASEGTPERLLSKPLRVAAGVFACLALSAPIAAALFGTPSNVNKPSQGQAGINRLQTADSDRQLYWKIAWQQFRSHPVKGTGSGAFRLAWVQSRYAAARPAVNAHSLEIETGAELGLIGLAALAAFLGGIALAARKAWRRDPRLCSAAAAGSILMFGHTAFDWDWQLPGVMLPALLLCALLVAQSEPRSDSHPSSALGSRIAVGLVALVAGGWLVHDWRSAELIAQAGKKLDAARVLGFTPQRYASIQDLLSQAEWLSADSEAARSKAITTILAGHPREGVDELKRLLANDPYDYLSWVALSRVSFRIGDQADFDLAQRALQSFHPALTGDGAAQAH